MLKKLLFTLFSIYILIFVSPAFAETIKTTKDIQTSQNTSIEFTIQRPDVSEKNQRFIDNGDGTITDNRTNFMWFSNGSCFGPMKWQETIEKVLELNNNPEELNCSKYTANYNNWRIPHINEFRTLINTELANQTKWLESQGFKNIEPLSYWSSTTGSKITSYVWTVDMGNGSRVNINKARDTVMVLPIRKTK